MVNLQSICLILAVLSLLLALLCFVWLGVCYSWGLVTRATRPVAEYEAFRLALVALAVFGFNSVLWFLQEIPFYRLFERAGNTGGEADPSLPSTIDHQPSSRKDGDPECPT